MKLYPNTLFARAMLVLISMIILSIVVGVFIYISFVTRPSAFASAQLFSQHINSVHYALANMKPEKRNAYINELVRKGLLQVNRDENAKPGRKADKDYEHIFLEYYPKMLFDKNAEIRFEYDNLLYSENPRLVWAKVNLGDRKIWLATPMSEFRVDWLSNLLSVLAVILVLTLVGAFFISRVVKKPLKQLTQSASLLGQGKLPDPIEEQGTEEFKTLARTFNKMSEDIQKLADDRNLMLAGISHDLRTPLARVRLALDMIDDKIDKSLYGGMVQDIEDIDKIVGQFLTFVRDGVDEPFTYEDVNKIVEHTASGFQLEGKHIELNLGSVEKSMIKPIALHRLLMNLINNAWLYGKQDVEVATSMNGHNLYIEVKDRGDGIAEADIEHLKQPFTRLDTSRSDTKGAGLGLAIVDRIVKWHHGKLDLFSRNGGGLHVRVTIPVMLQA
ncbi:MAG: ATP-binding protein [Thioalkalispiraceae bacterium]|jgi:two-component system osmolarity sensor histidine kinase EnvZ